MVLIFLAMDEEGGKERITPWTWSKSPFNSSSLYPSCFHPINFTQQLPPLRITSLPYFPPAPHGHLPCPSRTYVGPLGYWQNQGWEPWFLNFGFIYLFMAVLGLRFCARAFSSCGERGPLFIAVRGPLTVVASLVAEHRLQTRRLSNCGSRAQLLRCMWDLPRPGLEPVSPALAGRFPTTAPPGKPQNHGFIF